MMTNDETAGATAGDDTSGLRQPQLITKAARDAAELEAISEAYDRYIFQPRRKSLNSDWLTDSFIRQVHSVMFGKIWEWAGKYRTTALNLGIDPQLIPQQIQALCGDLKFWNASPMPEIEIAARLQNRLTRIHPFNNGNGRHARLITDIFFNSRGLKLPTWPQIQLLMTGDEIRKQYIAAMKAADQEDYRHLIQFIEDCIQGKF